MRLRSKIGLAAAAVLAVLSAAIGVAPYLIDVEAYKPGMIEAVREATGRELVIDGPMRLAVFPVPGIGAGSVHFSNAVGAKGAQMLDVRWVSVRPDWWALLQGRVEVGTLTLYGPTIVLEADADGKPNWEFRPGGGTTQPVGAPSAGLHLAVGRLDIVRGTVRYINPTSGKTFVAEDVGASASVSSFEGPFMLAGSATVNGVPLTLDLKVGASTVKGHDTSLAFQVSSGKLDFVGKLSAINPDARVTGYLSVQTGLLTDFIAAILNAVGGPPLKFDASAVGRFSFDGGIEIAPDRLAISDFQMTMGSETATGSLALDKKPETRLGGHVSLAKLDLEKWLALLSKPGTFAAFAPVGPAKRPSGSTAASTTALPSELNANVTLDVAEALYRKDTVRDLSVELDIAKGAIAVPRFKAVLPGEVAVQANASASGGDFSLAAPKLRDTLAWLGIATDRIPGEKLQTLYVRGKTASKAGGLQVNGATFEFDGVPGTAGAIVTFAAPFAVAASVAMDRFDLDAYMSKPSAGTLAVAAAPGAAAAPETAGASPSFGLKAKVAKLVYRGETLGGVEGDATVQGNLLKVADLKVADLLGARLELRGTAKDFATSPHFDLSFNATVPDADRLLAYAELPKFRNGKIGAATASGGVAGTMNAFSLRDVAVSFLGVSGRASGTLALKELVTFDFPSFSLQSSDASRLVSVASGRSMTGVGPISAEGSLKGTSARAAFNGDLQARGARMIGTIDATLSARPKITATLKVPGTLDLDHWLGVSANPVPSGPAPSAAPSGPGLPPVPKVGAATPTAIDLTALRSFDASLSLFTSTTSIASLKINYADFDATLSNGVLKVSKLTGQFYGGAVDFTGTVDASGAALGLDFAGKLEGIYLGEMLRGTTGNNNFGNSNLTLAIDGKLNALGIKLAAKGRSLQEIRDAVTGSATLGGYIYPSVIRGSRSFAQFATSVGSIFSDSMAFASLMLDNFIDRQSAIAGPLEISGGMVTLQHPTVRGQNAMARVTSRTSITEETTDTLISVFAGGNSAKAGFVVTLKGPISSPTFSTARGN